MDKLGEEIQESLNQFIGCPNNEDTIKDIQNVLENTLGENDTQSDIYINNVGYTNTSNCFTNTATSTISGSTMTINQPYLNNNVIFNGYSTAVQKETYEILGKKVELETIWDKNMINSIALINIHGYKFYKELKKNHINFPTDLEEAIEKIIRVLERDDKISAICA